MAFDISKLTNAVNRYLNSISDVSAAAKKVSEESAAKAQFGKELKAAIEQNIASRMNKDGGLSDATGQLNNFPDISGQIQNQIDTATSGIKSTFDQIDGGFEAIRSAGAAGAAGADNAGNTADNSNHDAYSGNLSPEALQELSRSQYFSTNLLQSDLFSEGGNSDKSGTDILSALSSGLNVGGTSGADILSALSSGLNVGGTSGADILSALSSGLNAEGTSGADILSALTSGLSSSGNSGASLGNLFDSDVSLSDLNNNSLLASTLTSGTGSTKGIATSSGSGRMQNASVGSSGSGKTQNTTATSSGTANTQNAANSGTNQQSASTELAAALLKAYKSSGTLGTVTSVFGDFSL